MSKQTVNAPTLAACFGITERRVQQLAAEGVLPRAGRGKYPLAEAVRGYLAHCLAGASSANEPDDLAAARKALLIEQARRERRANDLAESRTMLMPDVEHMLRMILVAVIGHMESLPGRCAADLAGMSHAGEIRQFLLAEVRGIRTVLADCFETVEKLPLPSMPKDCPLCGTRLEAAA